MSANTTQTLSVTFKGLTYGPASCATYWNTAKFNAMQDIFGGGVIVDNLATNSLIITTGSTTSVYSGSYISSTNVTGYTGTTAFSTTTNTWVFSQFWRGV